jgi:hypothetical protein
LPKGAIFHNADWIAGVDYDEDIQQDTEKTTKPMMTIRTRIQKKIKTLMKNMIELTRIKSKT